MITCLLCHGKGQIEESKTKDLYELKFRAAKILLKNKFGIRQTARILDYKSPRSIQVIKNKIK